MHKPSFNLLDANVQTLQELLANGTISTTSLVKGCLSQVQEYDEWLRAMLWIAPEEKLMKVAQQLDLERKNGKLRSTVHGMPIVLKDNIATDFRFGMPTTAGSLALLSSVVPRNAKIVEKLTSAGMIILGKSNLSELMHFKGVFLPNGWSALGSQTQSAYVPGLLDLDLGCLGHSDPSGSSTGSAVAVSAGYCPLSIGTDTDGSLICPAERAALYSLKLTPTLVSQEGIIPVSHSFDSLGPMAKTPHDLALILEILVDDSKVSVTRDYLSALTGSWHGIKVVALLPGCSKDTSDACEDKEDRDILEAYRLLQEVNQSFSGVVSPLKIERLDLNDASSQYIVQNADFVCGLNNYLSNLVQTETRTLEELILFNEEHRARELPTGAENQALLEAALHQKLSAAEYEAHLAHLRTMARDQGIDSLLRDYNANVIIGPTNCGLTTFASCAGYPMASLPLSYLECCGMPFGLVAVALEFQEALLLQVQSAWEATFRPRRAPELSKLCRRSFAA